MIKAFRRDTSSEVDCAYYRSDMAVFPNRTRTAIEHGLDRTHSIRTRTQLHTDPIAHRSDCAQTQSNAIAIGKTGKILIDNEKISVYISTRSDSHPPSSPPAKERTTSIIVLLLKLENLSCRQWGV